MKKPWEKVLYKKQNYPDNYTDRRIFLKDLRKNVDFREISFTEACFGANLVLQEFCVSVLFTTIYFYMVNKRVEPPYILYGTTSLSFGGFLFYKLKVIDDDNYAKKQALGHDVRTILTFVAFGQLFSPVLHTLTDTISTDTIYTMTFLMLLIHLIFFDYGVSGAFVSRSLSLSAAIFASICLASRLASASEAFIMLTVATQLFVLSPILRRFLDNRLSITVILWLIDFGFLLEISYLAVSLFVSVSSIVNIVCPGLFVKFQRYKDNIYGPWDEAVVKQAFAR